MGTPANQNIRGSTKFPKRMSLPRSQGVVGGALVARGLHRIPLLGIVSIGLVALNRWMFLRMNHYDETSWTTCCDLGGPYDRFIVNAANSCAGASLCGLSGQSLGGTIVWGQPIPLHNNSGTKVRILEQTSPSFGRYVREEYIPNPDRNPFQDPVIVREPYTPPHLRNNPRNRHTKRVRRFRDPNPRTREQDSGGQPHLGGRQSLRPYERPSDNTSITSRIHRERGRHRLAKPRKGEKEIKTDMAGLPTGALKILLNGVTEVGDFIDSIYEALPRPLRTWKGRDGKWRAKDITPQSKALRIYQHFDAINIGDAFVNLVVNQAEDFAFGKIGQASAKASRQMGFLAGIQTGPLF